MKTLNFQFQTLRALMEMPAGSADLNEIMHEGERRTEMNRAFGRFVLLAGGLLPAVAVAAALAIGMLTPAPARAQTTGWAIDATLYSWFQGVNGDVSALGRKVNVDASASDLLTYADLPFQGAVALRHRRLIALADASWTPLTVDKDRSSVVPLPPGMGIQVKYSPLILSGEAGYRVADVRGVAVDALAGARYWYLGTKVTLEPSPTGTAVDKTSDWVDPIVGARIQKAILPRLRGTVLGDIGGWGVGSQLDYQLLGALAYRIAPRLSLDAAWRQMYADYKQDQFHSKTTQRGLVAGLTLAIQ